MKVKENARFSTGESLNGKLRVKNGELGKRSNFAILAFFIFNSLIVSAANVTWTGGGDTSAWSDGGNWEGGIAPGAGDIALIPENTNAVATTAADITFMNALSSISVSSGATLCISNLGAAATMSVPLTGSGRFYVCAQPDTMTQSYLTLSSDNSSFSGIYAVTNAGLKANSEKCFGGQGGGAISVYLKGSQRFILAVRATYYNHLTIGAGNNSTAMCIAHESSTIWAGDIVVANTIAFHGNSKSFSLAGGLTRVSGDKGVRFYDGMNLSGTVDLKNSTANNVYLDNATLTLGGGNGNIVNLGTCFAKGTMKFSAANVFASWYGYNLNLGNNGNCTLDLNGFDQRLYSLAQKGSYTRITSASPATLKILHYIRNDTSSTPYQWNGGGVNSIGGRVSLDLESDAATISQGQAILRKMNCTTSGGLSCGRGTMTLYDNTATFSNLTFLTAYNTGSLVVNTAHVNPENGVGSLAVTNTAKMSFAADMVQKAYDAYLSSGAQLTIGARSTVKVSHRTYLDGVALRPGVYGKVGGTYEDGTPIPPAFQLSCLKGDGWLDTNGPLGFMLIVE